MENSKVYVVCGESNSMVVYDLKDDKSIGQVNTGSWPHSIDISVNRGLLFVSNLESDNVTVISADTYEVIKSIQVLEYPVTTSINNMRFIQFPSDMTMPSARRFSHPDRALLLGQAHRYIQCLSAH